MEAEQQAADVAKAGGVLARSSLPAEIVGFRVRPGEDHRGDPALWVELDLAVKGGELPDRARMREIVRFMTERQAVILAEGVRAWPFFKLVERVA